MTDEQLEKAIKCWTGTTVSEKECMACPYNDKCTLEEIANEIIHRWRECKTENVALRERLEKSVELPAKVMIERTIVNGKLKNTKGAQAFNGRIGVVYRDETKWKGLLVDICSENVYDYEAAEARLAELKGAGR